MTLLKKTYSWAVTVFAALAAMFIIACGDTTEEVTQVIHDGVTVVPSISKLPDCSDDNEGEQVFVTEESEMRICADGNWYGVVKSDFSCTTKELKDKRGIKIICNGDSIGVVMNGSSGDDGSGCSVTGKTDSTVTITCGDKITTLKIGSVSIGKDSLELDSERIAISMDSLTGYSQKGPFIKGSTVYLYELSDGRTLKQTNGNFVSNITRDDGHYKFASRNLASQYAMVVVEGNYRNEVTGAVSKSPIRLNAITNLVKRKTANVNILTHLEYERVYYLVTQKNQSVAKAKKKAQKEILSQFYIDTSKVSDAEDLDVFGTTEADANLLALSILLQGDRNETDLTVLLTEFSNDIAEDGKWDEQGEADSFKIAMADWALKADSDTLFAKFRHHVAGWRQVKDNDVPGFEKILRNFINVEHNLGTCGDKNNSVGKMTPVTNKKSRYYRAEDYDESLTFFICDDHGGNHWRLATPLEVDTLGWGHNYKNGEVRSKNHSYYVYENDNWRYGSRNDSVVGLGCIKDFLDTIVEGKDGVWYKCVDKSIEEKDAAGRVTFFVPYSWETGHVIELDTLGWGIDHNPGDVRNGQVNSDIVYVFEDGRWREGTELDSVFHRGCIKAWNDTLFYSGDYRKWYRCHVYSITTPVSIVWLTKWAECTNDILDSLYYLNNKNENGTLMSGPYEEKIRVWDGDTVRLATEEENELNRGCVSYIRGSSDTLGNTHSSYTCRDSGWFFDSVNVITDSRDGNIYKTIKIGKQYWMAENLYYEVDSSRCYMNSADSCAKYGRYYFWHAVEAMGDSLCPVGWHVPSKMEVDTLLVFVDRSFGYDRDRYEHNVAGWHLKSSYGWYERNGKDPYGFSALPAGYWNTYAVYKGEYAGFWTTTPYSNNSGSGYVFSFSNEDRAYVEGLPIGLNGSVVNWGNSIRCVRN